ncbi:MAG: hypothetical protein WBD22_03630 [Pyrinomonadaceae bacterium]
MAIADYMPRTAAKLGLWFQNFSLKLPTHNVVSALDTAMLHYIITFRP